MERAEVHTCPACDEQYAGNYEFCPLDGVRLELGEARDPRLGELLADRYLILAIMNRGSSGSVYRARQVAVEREVAVKILAPGEGADKKRVARFEQEAKALGRLHHPAVPELIDFGQLPSGEHYLVNPLLHGRPLSELLETEAPLPVVRALPLLEQLADCLIEAHAAGVIHRDLKPSNIFIERISGRDLVRVLDFGVARLLDTQDPVGEGWTIGTAPYMSPEQVRGDEVAPSSDLYALGVVAYECLSGRPPYGGRNYMSIVMKHLESEVPELSLDGPVAQPLADLVGACLEKLPEDRPASATELRDALTALRRLLETGEQVALVRSKSSRVSMVLAGLLAATLSVLAWSLWPSS